MSFDSTAYGKLVASLYDPARATELGRGIPHAELRKRLEETTDSTLFAGHSIRDADMAGCCRAALWLLHGFLDESHTISQAIHSPAGSYWHGIMHRRDGDYSNAKYWFRQAGSFPTDADLKEQAVQCAEALPAEAGASDISRLTSWDPARFVDLCRSACENQGSELCGRIAAIEWQLLFDHCYRVAAGS